MIWLLLACSLPDVPVDSRCVVEDDHRWCSADRMQITFPILGSRGVWVEVPLGDPPEDGWPTMILFQGTGFRARGFFEARRGDPFGGWYQTALVDRLLDNGIAVVAPNARDRRYWQTNVPPWMHTWTLSADHQMMLALFEAIEDGELGDLDPDQLHAAGISSGGYMTSRMARNYPGRFQTLSIQSASWATCAGALCVLPRELPDDHPPTLFLHGLGDPIVPVGTMFRYADALEEADVPVDVITARIGHAWLPEAPDAIVDHVLSSRPR